ncbi:MAG: GNAT family N-acetyltransferase [Phycisphaerales bacterium]|nr:GNAT family N-acetyltransferase [Phycisphaerales bacterium]
MGFRAKWEPDSFEYAHTIRRFDLSPADGPLLRRLGEVALQCWDVFELRGYARVDFRVDPSGRPWVLEVNANPCIAPDAGFMESAKRAGLRPEEVLARILEAAVRPPTPGPAAAPASGRVATHPVHCLELALRESPRDTDEDAIREMAAATGFFRPDEVEVAGELIRDRTERGPGSDYRFLLADDAQGRLIGYTCYGQIPCTIGSYDLSWIVVAPEFQGRGLGRHLLRETEARIRDLGGGRVYIETSSLEKYAPTQHFYRNCGYVLEARHRDFYQPRDDKLVFVRSLESRGS